MTGIIAEVAQGYEGRPDYARLCIKAAARAGADAVKFQIVYADDVGDPDYQYYDWFRQLQMSETAWLGIRTQCSEQGILMFTDVSGDRALAMAERIRPDGIKLHSSNFFNRSLARRALEFAPRLFISVGGIAEPEIAALIDEVRSWGALDRLTLLYGFQSEPTPVERSALARLPLLKQRFGVPVGYLDHVDGASPDRVSVSAMAIALGADWIEKHITISRFLEIEDFVSALEPDEFAEYVAAVRRLVQAMGTPGLELTEDELSYRHKAVKKVMAAVDMPASHRPTEAELILKRTDRVPRGHAIQDPSLVIGRPLSRAVSANQPITLEDLS